MGILESRLIFKFLKLFKDSLKRFRRHLKTFPTSYNPIQVSFRHILLDSSRPIKTFRKFCRFCLIFLGLLKILQALCDSLRFLNVHFRLIKVCVIFSRLFYPYSRLFKIHQHSWVSLKTLQDTFKLVNTFSDSSRDI